ncbi:MAG: tetratricopeptide repeat protein [Bacteroidetes bacterium]|nr:MAG: tetratricopeptide repeat protein [Bacteroidota bacterium]
MLYDVTNFQAEVINRSFQIPVLVDFWAEWCGPCKILGPVLERLAAANQGRWALAKVNTEMLTDIAIAYHIQSIPNVKLFFEGNAIAEFVGALPEPMITQWLNEHLPNKHHQRIEAAKKMLVEDKTAEAQSILENIFDEDPENIEAKVLLAKALLFTSPEKAVALLHGIEEPKFAETTDTVLAFTRLFELQEKPDELPESETTQRYLSAIAQLRQQNFDAALSAFVEIIRSDRYYDDDGSRKACIAIFKYLGEEHPVTVKHRREFSSALY